MAELDVYGFNPRGARCRYAVAAWTPQHAADALGVSLPRLQLHRTDPENDIVGLALAEPNTVFSVQTGVARTFRRLGRAPFRPTQEPGVTV